jgi:pyruvate/2-oxoglutarate dehydrogenase complex dihydrolipoamide acyltransferase (E2) component
MLTKWSTSMQAPVHLPDIGADVVWLSVWYVEVGERVFEGDRLVEVLANGATFDVSAPSTGRLIVRRMRPGQLVRSGDLLDVTQPEEPGPDT